MCPAFVVSKIEIQKHKDAGLRVYAMPFANNQTGFTGFLVGCWSLRGIVTLASGFPVNVVQSGDTWNADALWPRPNYVEGQTCSLDNPSPNLWFKTAAFSRSITYGTAPRNAIVGPGTYTFDLSASKSFRIYGENHRLLFRAEMFNAVNTPQFGNPGATLGTGTFGRVTSTAGDN